MSRKVIIGISIAVVVVITAVIASFTLWGDGTSILPAGKEKKAGDLFYDTLGNAAKQQQLRVAMYRATYPTKADAEAKQNLGTELSSVAEVDVAAGKARSVYATNTTSQAKPAEFTIGRCMDGATYSDDYAIYKTPRPTTLAQAADALKTNQHIYQTNVPIFIPCPNLGTITGASVDLAAFRFSDGVFPVTITAAQAENWKNKTKEADLFTIKDEGTVNWNGQNVKKISFTSKDEENTNRKLYSIFYETAEIDKTKAEHPNAVFEYEYIAMAPANTGGVGGYYLVDENTKLPVYSELYGTNKDSASRFNIARTKQTYGFGKPLSLTIESPLEILP